MKIPPSIVPILIAISVGFAAGWLCKSQLATPSAGGGKISTLSHTGTNPTFEADGSSVSEKDSAFASVSSGSIFERCFPAELKSLKRLPDAEFASRIVEAWFARREDPDNLLSRVLLSSDN